MEKQIITFSVNEQRLIKTGGIECYASNIVSYIEAHFDLGANWSGYDSVRAVWSNDNNMTAISTVLDTDGVCVVPFEVLKTKGIVKVNLVGSISVSDVLTDRLTTFPCEAVKVTAKAKTDGSETQPITPSQFEQFVAAVISEVEKVTGMTAQAETLPAGSQATARYENGILYLGIPQGIQGERGETGADGNGIASVVYNADYSLTLIFDNGERFTTPPIRGERGPAGQDGRDGTNGRDGADGVTPNLSIGTVETLEPTQDAYVTRRGTDANPIFDFGIPKGDKGDTGEVTMSQLSSLLPTDTASGDMASFSDGTDLFPALSVKAQIEPIQSGSGTPSPDNVRPISGHTEVVTEVCGKNLFDPQNVLNDAWIQTSTGAIASISGANVFYANVPKNADMTISMDKGNRFVLVGFESVPTTMMGAHYDNLLYDSASGNLAYSFNTGENVIIAVYTNRDVANKPNWIQFELGSTATDYEPYQGTTYTTDLGRTVYGGTLDVVSGELVVNRVMWTANTADMNNAEATPGWKNIGIRDIIGAGINAEFTNALMNIGSYWSANTVGTNDILFLRTARYNKTQSEWIALAQDVQIIAELATPQTYQLDPQTIDLLLGDNNVWTDCGSVEVTYKADVGLYIDKKLSSNGTRSLSMGLTKSATVEAETEAEPSKTEVETKTEETKTEASKTETETKAVEAETEEAKTEPSKTETETETR